MVAVELESIMALPGQTGIPGRTGTDMSIISDKLFLRSIGSISDATLKFNRGNPHHSPQSPLACGALRESAPRRDDLAIARP